MSKGKYQIFDWMSNRIDRAEWPSYWESFEDAEHDLAIFLSDEYEDARQEYYIELVEGMES